MPTTALRPKTIETPDGGVSVEPFAATLRYHPKGGYGTPFTFACTLTIVAGEARLFAGRGAMTTQTWRALSEALRLSGFEHAVFERRNTQRPRRRKVKLKLTPPE